ncbi:ABC transporter substrate-binding protein [Sulfurimonas sp.]|jgi:ABC-type nitrate/sulfonate/bicarbonate transport system substrate-binding protein/signal transduction histidine kinase|uniref:ABC transporter substrate-binding protein n=1 Tax=Sulfurimonas sp. TaxID=2022749 RepID=UPI002A362EBA|nr:ABC transporter substrate-binding protein [Sulfurimonas sp.]MDY0122650.1 ABC transporter substrate-binding protein [Sulfurimonas sp.]
MKYIFTLMLIAASLCAAAKPMQKVSLQLQWLDQFQFAGYYMAKEKGFYADAGFDVEIKKFTNETDVVGDVLSGKTTYGIGRSSLIWNYARGKEISLLSAIFQSSPLTLIALKTSNIENIKDFSGKKIMITEDAVETASVHAMIKSSKIDEKSIEFKRHTFDIEDLIGKKVDLYAGYISNEPYLLQEKGIKYKLFSPKERGFDFYSDLLFTSQDYARKNPQSVNSFNKASIKGWEYAFKNIDETVELIYKKYNPTNKTRAALMFEAFELKKLAYIKDIPFGSVRKSKIERILDIYRLMGLVESEVDMSELIFSSRDVFLTKEEKEYLRKKQEVSVCAISSMLPLSDLEHGEFIGVAADILKLTKENINVEYRFIKSSGWEEAMQKVSNKECDILPMSVPKREDKDIRYTTFYHHEPLVIVTRKSQNYIVDVDSTIDKEFVVASGNPFVRDLKKKHPWIKLNYVDSLKDGFRAVERGKYYGYIDTLISTAYAFKNSSNGHLRISGQFDDKIGISFGVRGDDATLFNIYEKLSRNLKHPDVHNYFNNWVSVNYVNSVKFEYLKETLFLVLVVIFIFFYRQHIFKKKNSELEELKDKLLELNQTLELKISDAVNEMQKKDTYLLHKSRLAQIGEIVSMIAHQWKQPLSTISALNISMIMAIELEQYDLSDEKQRKEFLDFLDKKLKKIEFYTNNMGQIITDFSDFYRPNKHQEECTLNDPVFQVYWLLEGSLASENIDLSLELGSTSRVKLFKNEFVQVLVNIINNAREQFNEKGIEDAQISIKSYDIDGVAVMEISDNAGGIDEKIIDKIFDPYFSTKFDKNGTGLGLHMSKNIIKQHKDGKLYVENIQGGAKFIIEVGISEDKDEE